MAVTFGHTLALAYVGAFLAYNIARRFGAG